MNQIFQFCNGLFLPYLSGKKIPASLCCPTGRQGNGYHPELRSGAILRLGNRTAQKRFKCGQQPFAVRVKPGILGHIIARKMIALYQNRSVRRNRHVPAHIPQPGFHLGSPAA